MNAVLGTVHEKVVRVGVELNGGTVDTAHAGSDVEFDSGESFLLVREHRLYDIVRTLDFETNELRLITDDESLCIYTYTFG